MLMIVYLFHALLITVVVELIFIHFNKLRYYVALAQRQPIYFM